MPAFLQATEAAACYLALVSIMITIDLTVAITEPSRWPGRVCHDVCEMNFEACNHDLAFKLAAIYYAVIAARAYQSHWLHRTL